jgi:hypothetical protein
MNKQLSDQAFDLNLRLIESMSELQRLAASMRVEDEHENIADYIRRVFVK